MDHVPFFDTMNLAIDLHLRLTLQNVVNLFNVVMVMIISLLPSLHCMLGDVAQPFERSLCRAAPTSSFFVKQTPHNGRSVADGRYFVSPVADDHDFELLSLLLCQSLINVLGLPSAVNENTTVLSFVPRPSFGCVAYEQTARHMDSPGLYRSINGSKTWGDFSLIASDVKGMKIAFNETTI